MSAGSRRQTKIFTLAALVLVAAGVFLVRESLESEGLVGPEALAAKVQTRIRESAGGLSRARAMLPDLSLPEDMVHEISDEYLGVRGEGPVARTELAALYWCAREASDSKIGRRALARLSRVIPSIELDPLADAVALTLDRPNRAVRPLASGLLVRVRQEPDHVRSAQILAAVCSITCADVESREPDAVFQQAADLFVARYLASPEIRKLVECLIAEPVSPRWGTGFQEHLQKIADGNPDPSIQCRAVYAQACLARRDASSTSIPAEDLFQKVVDTIDGAAGAELRETERDLLKSAETALTELAQGLIGQPAPEIVGVDVAGAPLRLSEYRGRVVLLSFWASWYFPCTKFLPIERTIAERLEGKPFAIVGVNGDVDAHAALAAMDRYSVTWASFQDQGSAGPSISKQWDVLGWPTVYLIDHEGIVRERWVDCPPPEELNLAIDRLVRAVN